MPGATQLLTVKDAATVANVHEESVRRGYQSGALRIRRIGRSIRIHPADLENWLENGGRTRAAA